MRLWLTCLLALLCGCATTAERGADRQALTILVSIDGFRADYLEPVNAPNLMRLASEGVRAKVMRPSFPSLTFPNHYTIVTGLRPDEHGIVNNTMEDAGIPGVTFKLSNREAVEDRRWWDDAEPIWVTLEKAGIRTATMFWPGSEAPIHGVRPSDWVAFDDRVTNEARVATVLSWLDRPESSRPRFVTLYFSEVDHDGHEFGPDDPRIRRAVANVDRAIGTLVDGLKQRGLAARTNLVIVSDHGMAAVSDQRVVRLDKVIDPKLFRAVSVGAIAGLEPTAGNAQTLATAVSKPIEHVSCWPKAKIPARLHYGRHRRVPSIVCLAEPGWWLEAGAPERRMNGGAHGYDNMAPEMGALFIASGPAFKQGVVIPEIANTDVYPLLAKLEGIRPLSNDRQVSVFAARMTAAGPQR